jgi:HSP20 family protein
MCDDWGAMLSFPEVSELSEDVRRIFEELDRAHASDRSVSGGIYTPLLDVIETSQTVEVVVDVPGIAPEAIRVQFKNGSLIVAGEKLPAETDGPDPASFHLVERGFGRFARVIRFGMAVDAGRARATLAAGQLRITVPRIDERRGREIRVAVAPGPR